MSKTVDIKELVKRLRIIGPTLPNDKGYSTTVPQAVAFAADALEAMAEKLQRDAKAAGYWMERSCAAENERDRLKDRLDYVDRDVAIGIGAVEAVKRLTAERDRLKAALEKIEQGDYPRDGRNYYNSRLLPSKHDTCVHGKAYWEDCGNCCSLFARKALGGDAS